MRCTSRGFIAIGSLLACLVTGGAATAQDKPATPAPDKPADNMDVLREKMRADKRAVVNARFCSCLPRANDEGDR